MTYLDALRVAMDRSKPGCTVHVSAILSNKNNDPKIVGYAVTDWYDASVVVSFTNGIRHD